MKATPGSATPDPAWVPKPLSKLSAESTEIPWVWEGYLARGFTTVLTGLWKSGKTTMVCRLLKALEGQPKTFCGRPATKAKVMIVSEEPERLWVQRRDELDIGDHVRLISRPFLKRPNYKTWEQFIFSLALRVAKYDYTLVVFDSLPNLWPVHDENDASTMLEALTPLNALTQAGAAVLLVAHPAKSDSGEGRATRGSGALGGFVDVIVEARRYDPERREDTRRVLTAYSRFEETPPEVVLAFDRAHGYSVVGTKADIRSEERIATALALLPDASPGATVEEILKRWPIKSLPRPAKRTLGSDLAATFERGELGVARTGRGRKGDPYRYCVVSIPASPPPCTSSLPETDSDSRPVPRRVHDPR